MKQPKQESIISGVSQKDYEKMVKKALKESIKMQRETIRKAGLLNSEKI